MKNAALRGKPDAGNPHVRFDEGEVAPAKPRRGSLLYKKILMMALLVCMSCTILAAQPFLKVNYQGKEVNVYGCLDQKILCVESFNSWPPRIINVEDLDEHDARRVMAHARQKRFDIDDKRIRELTELFVMSNSVVKKVDLTLHEFHEDGLIVYQYASREYDIKLTYVLYVHPDELTDAQRTSGIDLPLMHRWGVGKCVRTIDGQRQELDWRVNRLDDAVKLLCGWMVVHENDFYVKCKLAGRSVPRKHKNNITNNISTKSNFAMITPKAKLEHSRGIDVPACDYNTASVVAKVDKEEVEELRRDRKRKAKAWGRNNYQERSLSQYKSFTQRLRRKQIKEVSELLAEMAVAYKGKGRDYDFKENAAIINRYYKSDYAYYWSTCSKHDDSDFLTRDIFAREIGSVLDFLRIVITDFGDVDDYAKRRDKLMLQIQCGVNSLEELRTKNAARKAMEERAEKEQLFLQEERRIQAIENAADAIRNQTMDVYHHW